MTMEFKVRTWLWVVLAAVVLIGGGVTWWYVKGSKGTTSTTTSPTPIKSATVSPGASVSPESKTSTPANGSQAATPNSNVETKTWEGKLGSAQLDCVPTISFSYPADYIVGNIITPTLGGGSSLSIDRINTKTIVGGVASYTHDAQYESIYCVNFNNLSDYYNAYKTKNSSYQINNYTSLTINGKSAIQWTEVRKFAADNYQQSQPTKMTAIQNSNNTIVTFEINDSNGSEAYDIVVNSFQFK